MNVANLTIRVLFVRIDVAFYLITFMFTGIHGNRLAMF